MLAIHPVLLSDLTMSYAVVFKKLKNVFTHSMIFDTEIGQIDTWASIH